MKALKHKLTTELKSRIQDETEAVATGSLENMKDYGLRCGRVQGLRDALAVLDEAWDDYFNTIEDEDKEFLG